MNYEQFRSAWYEALTEAGMWSYMAPPTESVELGGMSRTYQIYIHFGHSREIEPFQVNAGSSWTWDALQAARTATTEEDALMQFLGDEDRHQDTERPWLRVDVILTRHAALWLTLASARCGRVARLAAQAKLKPIAVLKTACLKGRVYYPICIR